MCRFAICAILVTGLRSRFFFITFIVLLVVSAGTIVIHSAFMKADRIRLLDQQARAAAQALIDSDLNTIRIVNFQKANEIISEELGQSQIGKFFIIKNGKGEVIFASPGVEDLMKGPIPDKDQWYRFETKDQLVSVLNLKLPRVPDRSLQVGILINKSLVEPNYLSKSSAIFVLAVISLGLMASLIASSFLMRPIRALEDFLSSTISRHSSELPNLPERFMAIANSKAKDEFRRLLFGLKEMIDKVNRNYRSSRLWGYQMAHELKTPLTLIMLEAERGQRQEQAQAQLTAIQSEATKINDTIQSFLGWAELENSTSQKHLFAIRLQKIVEMQVERLKYAHGERVRLLGKTELTVVCNPQHLEQVVSNLVTNALRYSPADKAVNVAVAADSLSIVDKGSGIPKQVLDRIGEPFNKGASNSEASSHGLGLAWVNTIVRLYNWQMSIESTSEGSVVTVRFPTA